MLPQRRKSAEEIAKLRESMGIPGVAAGEDGAPPSPPLAPPPPAPAAAPEKKAAPAPQRREASAAAQTQAPTPAPQPPAFAPEPVAAPVIEEEPLAPRLPKPVRSLRKSEQGLVERTPAATASNKKVPAVRTEGTALPQRRHNERELMEMRRVQSAAPDQSINHLQHLAVRWYWVVLAYALPLLGMLCAFLAHWLPDVPAPDFPTIAMAEFSRMPWLGTLGFWLLASFSGLGLLMAGWFAWKKPRSRHHAGFIAILAFLVLVFGIIHQFTPDYGP
jgi:hypothetical protein